MEKTDSQVEAGGGPKSVPHWRLVIDQGLVTPEVLKWPYPGSGTEEDPFVVSWIENDPRNPMLFPKWKKWALTMCVAIATLAVAFVSSAYSGGIAEIMIEFGVVEEIGILGVSLFVLGFAIGPLLWAPLSEMFGRQILFITTYAGLTAFNGGACGAKNIQTLIILRFFAGAIGSSPLTNAGGVIADMFSARDRGLATTFFAAAPFLGPVVGPIVGGFVGETVGWRWIEGVMTIFTGVLWIIGTLVIPETYPPVILRKRAAKLSKMTGKVYMSRGDVDQGQVTLTQVFRTSLSRPWILLFQEPIVFLLSVYMAIIYGTLYMLFSAFPIVYEGVRGWSQGISGLAFLGVAVGMFIAVAYSVFDNRRYIKLSTHHKGFAPPESRLPPCMVGGIALPIGLFWFAWTNYASVHWMASIAAGAPFGFGMVLVFLGIMNYLIDAYTIFAASVLAANSVLRSLFGCIFPLFTTYMFQNLGIHWASSIPAFLALACVPMPFVFYKYGAVIRKKCKYAAQSAAFMQRMQSEMTGGGNKSNEKQEEAEAEAEQTALDYSYDTEEDQPQFEQIKTSSQDHPQQLTRTATYESNPFDIDRVNTKESFHEGDHSRSRASSVTSRTSRASRAARRA